MNLIAHDGGDSFQKRTTPPLNVAVKGVKLVSVKLANWPALCSSFLLFPSSTLLLVNGSCSKPHSLTADFPVCIGGQFSIQAWPAIMGMEFSVACSVLPSRLLSIGISKAVTSTTISKDAS